MVQQTAALYARLAPRNNRWPDPQRPLIVLNLLADAILLEQGWFATNVFNVADFTERTGIPVHLVRVFSATRDLGGYQVVWNRPRPSALATVMGSLFVYEAERPLGSADYTALADLQYAGIGERRQEGFGQVRICDDIHLYQPPDDVAPR
ncbi:MAG: hypothetical protein HC822_26970 [Oscillochloris sp.]|nr:hypothetical protein [Oscillochloris sp.]